jgi:hypothetical protein
MELLSFATQVLVYLLPYILAFGVGGYVEYKFGQKIVARVAALEAAAKADVAKVEAKV